LLKSNHTDDINRRNLKMFKFLGVVLIVLAVAIAVVPTFTDCQSQGSVITMANGSTTPMKCHWTGVAELGMAIPLVGVGIMMMASRRKETLSYLSVTGIVLAGVMIALPDGLIGVCANPTHVCVTAMKPALNSLGALVALGGIVGLIQSRRIKEI
jgi:hypothetical protein